MADLSVFKINGGISDTIETAAIAAAAASQTITHSGKDSRLALRVANGNSTGITADIAAAGGGPRAALGDMKVTVGAGKTAYIALFDTARYKDLSTGSVTVNLTNAGSALTAEQLAAVKIEAIQM